MARQTIRNATASVGTQHDPRSISLDTFGLANDGNLLNRSLSMDLVDQRGAFFQGVDLWRTITLQLGQGRTRTLTNVLYMGVTFGDVTTAFKTNGRITLRKQSDGSSITILPPRHATNTFQTMTAQPSSRGYYWRPPDFNAIAGFLEMNATPASLWDIELWDGDSSTDDDVEYPVNVVDAVELYVRDGGAWKEMHEGSIRDGGAWKRFVVTGVDGLRTPTVEGSYSNGLATLTWDDVSTLEDGWEVQVSATSPVAWTRSGVVNSTTKSGTGTEYTSRVALREGQSRYFRVLPFGFGIGFGNPSVAVLVKAETVDPDPDPIADTASVNVRVDPVLEIVDEGDKIAVSASATGDYDRITWAWSGAGTFDDPTAASTMWTAPQVDETGDVAITATATVRGQGTRAKDGTTATDSDSENIRVADTTTPPPFTAQNVALTATAGQSLSIDITQGFSGKAGATYSVTAPVWLVVSGTTITGTVPSDAANGEVYRIRVAGTLRGVLKRSTITITIMNPE